MNPDRGVKPHLNEVKKVYQNIGFEAISPGDGIFSLKNKFSFTNLEEYHFSYKILADGQVVEEGDIENVKAGPGSYASVGIKYQLEPKKGVEYFINLYASQREAERMIPAGHIIAYEQFSLPFTSPGEYPGLTDGKGVRITANNKDVPAGKREVRGMIEVSNDLFTLTFDADLGELTSLKSNGKELICESTPNFWRAPIDNDFGNDLHIRARVWRKAGERKTLKSCMVSKEPDQTSIAFSYDLTDSEDRVIAGLIVTYKVRRNGDIKVSNEFAMLSDDLPEIPRFGTNYVMPREFDQISWYGRGPHESYWDRKTSALIGIYEGRVSEQYWAYIRPQENGNKTDMRWMAIANKEGEGLMFIGDPTIDGSAHHHIMEDFESLERTDGRQVEGVEVVNRHTTDVETRELTSVNVDYKQMGLGGDTSWGAWTHDKYRLTEKSYAYGYTIRLLSKGDYPADQY